MVSEFSTRAQATRACGEALYWRSRLVRKLVIAHELPTEEMQGRLAWLQGMLRLRGGSLPRIVEEFNRYKRLVIDEPSLASLRLGGSFGAINREDLHTPWIGRFGIHADQAPVRGTGDASSRRRTSKWDTRKVDLAAPPAHLPHQHGRHPSFTSSLWRNHLGLADVFVCKYMPQNDGITKAVRLSTNHTRKSRSVFRVRSLLWRASSARPADVRG